MVMYSRNKRRVLSLIGVCALLAWCNPARSGELMERFEALKSQGEQYRPIGNPGDPAKILAVGLERTRAFVSNTPAYEVVLERDGAIAYRGTGGVERLGEFRGTIRDATEFQKLAELICVGDFFELPNVLLTLSSDVPGNAIVVRTAEGEKWISDPNFTREMNPTTRMFGERIDELLAQSSLTEEKAIRLTSTFSEIPIAAELPRLSKKLHTGEPVTFVCLGDSVTGVYYHTGGRRAYTDMLKLALEQGFPGVEFTAINAGVSGNTTVDALARLEKDVLSRKPDLVTIMFGLNDTTRVPLEDYRANLKSIIAQCRAAGAEVVLCTPNSVTDTPDRPTSKLLEYCAVVREVAASDKVTLADCYNAFEAIRTKKAQEWAFLMSDEIHPNMDGHRELARSIAYAIAGRSFAIQGGSPLQPAIPHTLALIRAKQPIEVLAMPPYDKLLEKLLHEIAPDSPLTVTTWRVAGKSLAEIEESAKTIRDNPPDWVFIAVPLEAKSPDFEDFRRHYTWTMNYALSFAYQEWDVTAVPPSFTEKVEGEADKERDQWAGRLIWAQDLDPIDRGGSVEPPEAKLRKWLKEQLEK